jgi:hypothetical protein
VADQNIQRSRACSIEIVAAFRFRRVIANEFLLGLSGVVSIVLACCS